jgi:hypothetical protein
LETFCGWKKRKRIATAIFVASSTSTAACGQNMVFGSVNAGGGGGASVADDATSDVSRDEGSAAVDATADSIIVIIVGPSHDGDILGDGSHYCAPMIVGQRQRLPPPGVCDDVDAGTLSTTFACLPPPPNGMSCDEAYDLLCVRSTYSCGIVMRADSILCGPVSDSAGDCCYLTQGQCAPD